MGLFRNAMGLFRGRAGENREKATAELPNEAAAELPNEAAAELPNEAAAELPNEAAAELPDEQTMTVNAQPAVAPREVKREARPNPDEPGWGRTISL